MEYDVITCEGRRFFLYDLRPFRNPYASSKLEYFSAGQLFLGGAKVNLLDVEAEAESAGAWLRKYPNVVLHRPEEEACFLALVSYLLLVRKGAINPETEPPEVPEGNQVYPRPSAEEQDHRS